MNKKTEDYIIADDYTYHQKFFSEVIARVKAHNISMEVRDTPFYVIHIPSGDILHTFVNGERRG